MHASATVDIFCVLCKQQQMDDKFEQHTLHDSQPFDNFESHKRDDSQTCDNVEQHKQDNSHTQTFVMHLYTTPVGM